MIASAPVAAFDLLRRSRRGALLRRSSSSAQSSRSCCVYGAGTRLFALGGRDATDVAFDATAMVVVRFSSFSARFGPEPLGVRGMGGIPCMNSDALSLERGAQRSEHRKRGFRSAPRQKTWRPTTNDAVASNTSSLAEHSFEATDTQCSPLTTSAQRDFGSSNRLPSRACAITHRRLATRFNFSSAKEHCALRRKRRFE
jgi:hypothetical protein